MSDNLDNDLKNRIREVFDNYGDDAADAGWRQLRQKFPGKQKDRVIGWWWYSAAAILLLCLGTWFFYPKTTGGQVASLHKKNTQNTHTQNRQMAAGKPALKPAVIDQTSPVNSVNNHSKTVQTGNAAAHVDSPARQMAANVSAVPKRNRFTTTLNSGIATGGSGSQAVVSSIQIAHQKHNRAAKSSTNAYTGQHPATTNLNIPIAVAGVPDADSKKLAKQKKTDLTAHTKGDINTPPLIANTGQPQANTKATDTIASTTGNDAPEKKSAVLAQTTSDKPKTDAVLKMFADDQAKQTAIAKNETKKKASKPSGKSVVMSVYAATYFTYAKGSNNQVNVGAGFTSDIKLNNNFKLSTGLSIAQNKLNYNNSSTIPQQLSARTVAAANSAQASPGNSMFSLVGSGTYNYNSTSPIVKSYNATLIGLDIPLNIKYQFNPQKSDAFISAGISSGTYINEKYSSSYTYYNAYTNNYSALVTNSNPIQSVQQTSDQQHFTTFDFAKTLNLSFGIGYPVGRNRLIVEPFLKYPLGGLGSQNIQFGAGGVNLKLNLNSGKNTK